MDDQNQYMIGDLMSEIEALRSEISDNQARIAELEASVEAQWVAHP